MVSAKGHTLVELLISMALSLILMLGVVRVFSDSSQTFAVVVEQALMQENGRFGLSFIEQQVRRSGYVNDIDVGKFSDRNRWTDEFFPASESFDSSATFAAGAVIAGLDNTAEAGFKAGSDVLHIRYQKSESVVFQDCMGTNLDVDMPLTNIISFYVDGEDVLRCKALQRQGGNRVPGVLVEGISDLQILYGVDVDQIEPIQADRYVSAEEINAEGEDEWLKVVSLRVALLADSGPSEKSFVKGRLEQAYEIFNQKRTYSDGRAREIFQQTIHLRNRHL